MRQAFVTATGIPFSNRDLLESPLYRGRDDLFLGCTMARSLSKMLFPAIWSISINPDEPVVIGNTVLQGHIEAERKARMQVERLKAGLPEVADLADPEEKKFRIKPLLNRTEHRETYQSHRQKTGRSPHGFPFTLGVGGFLYVERDGEEQHNDPRQFVLERNGAVNPGVWTQPSGLASADPFRSMCQEITEEAGLVLLDDQQKTATVAVPDFVFEKGSEYEFINRAMAGFDGMAIKQKQAPNIRAVLEREGKGDYRILFQKFEIKPLTDNLPPQDKVELIYPLEGGMVEYEFRAFVVKDCFGSINIHLPFKMTMPENARLLTIDCEGYGRLAALKTQDELLALDRNIGPDNKPKSLVTAVLHDLVERPFKLSHIPNAAPAGGQNKPRAADAPIPAPAAP